MTILNVIPNQSKRTPEIARVSTANSETTVNMVNDGLARPRVPVVARLPDGIGDAEGLDRVRLDDKGREEAARGVPGDVAVVTPDACLRGTRVG